MSFATLSPLAPLRIIAAFLHVSSARGIGLIHHIASPLEHLTLGDYFTQSRFTPLSAGQ